MNSVAYFIALSFTCAVYTAVSIRQRRVFRRCIDEIKSNRQAAVEEAAARVLAEHDMATTIAIQLLLRRVGPWLECDGCGASPRPAPVLRITDPQTLAVLCQECAHREEPDDPSHQ